MVKSILRKQVYLLDRQEKAALTVLELEEVLSEGAATVFDRCGRSAYSYTGNLYRIVNSQLKVIEQ